LGPDDLQGRLPHFAPEGEVHAASVPPQRLPIRNGLPLSSGRGEGLAAGHHNQADSPRHPGVHCCLTITSALVEYVAGKTGAYPSRAHMGITQAGANFKTFYSRNLHIFVIT